ncbi:MAG: dihydrodipicolinate synthase family protein [Clostridiales bacterium]|nr:dihydrodipicolinate synthase family protein [Clostridiales bacterium]
MAVEKDFYKGVYALMLTPYKEDLSVDYDAFERYADWQVNDQNPHGIFPVCGSSEMTALKLEERIRIAQLAVKHKGDKKVFVTGNLEPSWFAQVDEVKKMEQTGVDGLVFTTRGMGNDEDRLVTYIAELATHTSLPIIMYEFPGMQPAPRISGKCYGELVKTGRVYGIKDTTCTMEGIQEKIDNDGGSAIIQANVPYLFKSWKAGAKGVMATSTTCGAKIFRRMWDSFTAGDLAAAEEYHAQTCLLSSAVDEGFTATAKYMVSLQGVPMNTYTRTGSTLSPQKAEFIRVWHDWAVRNGIMDK